MSNDGEYGADPGAVGGVDDGESVEGGRPARPPLTPAQRRVRRQTITLLFVSGLLLVGFVFAAAYYEGWFASGTPTASPCHTNPAVVQPSQIKVNVYNASKRTGLAAHVAAQMKARGFSVGSIANDPLHKTFKQPAQVRYGPKGKSGARLVSAEVSGSSMVSDKRKNATVDLVLGSSYNKLLVASTTTATASPSCSPTASGTATTGKATSTDPKSTKSSKTTTTAKAGHSSTTSK